MTTDVMVVGGGIAGLTAAAICARAGLRTTVLEGAAEVGGRASTDDVDGFRFDRGGHAIYPGGHATRVLADLRIRLPMRSAFTAGSSVIVDGELHPMPDGLGSLALASWLGAGGRMALAAWYGRITLGLAPPEGNVAAWVEPLPGRARRLAEALCRVSTYSGELDRMDAGVTAAQLRTSIVNGVRYVEGGWQTMVDALRACATSHGAVVRTHAAARAVSADHVRTDDGELAARLVILAVPPARAEELLGTTLPDRPAPARVASLQLALRDEVVRGPTRRLVMSCDAPVFVSNFSPVVPLGPEGVQVVHVTRYLGGRAEDPRAEIDRVLDAAWPAWRGGVVAERWMPSMVAASSLPEPGLRRLQVDAAPDVLLAGDGYGDRGHLADAAFASAEEAAGVAIARLSAVGARVAA